MTVRYRRYEAGNLAAGFIPSSYGYWLLPDGSIIALDERHSHGRVAIELDPVIKSMYENQLSRASIFASNNRNWIGITMCLNSSILAIYHGQSVTRNQIRALNFINQSHDLNNTMHCGDLKSPTARHIFDRMRKLATAELVPQKPSLLAEGNEA